MYSHRILIVPLRISREEGNCHGICSCFIHRFKMLYRSIHWNLNLVYPPEAPITLYQVRDESQEEVSSGRDCNKCSPSPPSIRLDLPSSDHPSCCFWLTCHFRVAVSRCLGFSISCVLVRSINYVVPGTWRRGRINTFVSKRWRIIGERAGQGEKVVVGFVGRWEVNDVDEITAYWETHLILTVVGVEWNLYVLDWHII